jgi:hypothetical protein
MAKLLVAVTIAVLALGTVITQGTALLQTFPEHDTVYVFKTTINGGFLSRVPSSNIDHIEVAGGTDPYVPGPESQFRSTVLLGNKVAFQVPAIGQEYVRRMSPGQDLVFSQTNLDAESEFTYEFISNGPTANSGYLRLIADDGSYLRIESDDTIKASAATQIASTQFIVWKLPGSCA